MSETGNCGDCKFWASGLQECRRNAPAVNMDSDPPRKPAWPRTDFRDWCGEFKPKEEK